ncbi:hypothetical protein GT204_27960 [Streptomyces sp. SID4919]|uniref:hypothetical protein n=1 Tax=unclassified Streptomyces TaxID=2593676 RepID=UPI0008237EED|nr:MULTISPECIES: hypothetical protein [unclassified Streptomyces]MYY12629.1 hypothetical protein [Streptomyces sp. SID4919]SCK19889.1 hypothetical protein YW7DRAFT_01425 [Streptomyces sp. AmelKG-E11A]
MAEVRNTFKGPVGSVSGDHAKVNIGNVGDGTGTVNDGVAAPEAPALLELIEQLRTEIAQVRAELPERDASELDTAVAQLEEEARLPEPQPSRLRRFARTVRDILADAGETLAPFGTAVGIYSAVAGG